MKAINEFKALRKAINNLKQIWNFKQKFFFFCGSNALWNYVMVNASLRSHIIHHDQSGLSRPFLQEKKIISVYNVVKR
jgi:hypothetical protein